MTWAAPPGYNRPHDRHAAAGGRPSGNGVGRLGLDTILQLALNGLAVGCIYGLVALGFVLIYKATELVNFAQGDLLMLGAFTCYMFVVWYGVGYWAAFALAVADRRRSSAPSWTARCCGGSSASPSSRWSC